MIAVLGIGNVLMGDDGFGPAVVRTFDAEYAVGADVDVVDVGTPGLDLTPWLADADAVIIVDTVKSAGPPGTLRMYGKTEILRHAPAVRVGPHDPGVKEALLTLEFAGRAPRHVLLVGVVPQRLGMSTDLSDAVRRAVPKAIAAVVNGLEEFGRTAVRRPTVRVLPPWWSPAVR